MCVRVSHTVRSAARLIRVNQDHTPPYLDGHSTALNGLTQGTRSIGRCGSSGFRDLPVAGFHPWGIARRCRFNTLSIYEIQVISRKESFPLRV